MTSQLVLSAVLIVVTMVVLDWLESTRSRIDRARRHRREPLDARLPAHIATGHHRRTNATRGTA